MKYKYILFDLDGTITEPKEGITKSMQYALRKYNINIEDLDSLVKFIGPPLMDSFQEHYGFSEEKAKEAVEFYREYYREKGMFENLLYPGISEMLKNLKNIGCTIILATSKPTVFAEQILGHFNIRAYFDYVVGSNLDGTRGKKGDIIKYIIDMCSIKNLNEVIMVGDRKYDIIGAQENNIDSIGVTFGYGSIEELKEAKPTYISDSAENICNLIF
ncbi:MAG: HAD family hydrolase [Solirubrobacterales bacterium]